MNKSTYALIGGVIGAAIGAGATYIYMQRKTTELVSDAIDGLRKYYGADDSVQENRNDASVTDEPADGKSCEPTRKYTQEDYKDYTKCRSVPFRVDTEMHENEDGELEAQTLVKMGTEAELEPYSIPPEDFDADNGYRKIMLIWYEKNKVLAYDNNPRITIDPDNYHDTVGDFEDHFDDWEKDTVYMRNEVEETDYEIDACLTDYDELLKVLPYDDLVDEEGVPIDG